jgi:hypothetical protein
MAAMGGWRRRMGVRALAIAPVVNDVGLEPGIGRARNERPAMLVRAMKVGLYA